MMDFVMSFDLVPGILVAVAAPVAGIVSALALSGVAFAFASLAAKALHRPAQPKPARVTALGHARQAA